MAKHRRKQSRAVSTLTDPVSSEVTGWIYEWDNGQTSHLMKASLPPWLQAAMELRGEAEG